MAEKATIARPYARAAFDYAREQSDLAGWSATLAIGGAVTAEPSVGPLLGNPRVPAAQLVDLITGIAAQRGTQVAEPGRNFLALLAQNHRLGLLPEISAQFEQLRADVENMLDVEVVTAMPMPQMQRASLAAALARRFDRQVRIRETIDESLVGGALVRAGDLVIDGSLKGRLARLATQMSQQ